MHQNTPPHEDQYSDYTIEDDDEVYELADEDGMNYLDDGGAMGDSDMDGIENVDDDDDADKINTIVYSKHAGSVFCCSFSPIEAIGASGGEDDLAYVWDCNSGNTLFECLGHKDSVISVCFSHDGNFLATGDMNGYIQVWKISTHAKVWQFETDDLNWLLWHSSSTILFGGTSSGDIWMWLIPRGNTKTLSQSGSGADCGALTSDGKRICVAYSNGEVKVLDLKGGQTLHSFSGHTNQVTSLSTHPQNTLLLTGSTDGTAKVFNTTSGMEISSFKCSAGEISSEASTSADGSSRDFCDVVEVVSFCPSLADLAVTATLSGVLTIWNVSSQTSRHHIIQGCGTSSIHWIPDKPYFVASGLDGVLRIYDVRSGEQLFKFRGHKEGILGCDVSKNGSIICTSSDDGSVRILHIGDLLVDKND